MPKIYFCDPIYHIEITFIYCENKKNVISFLNKKLGQSGNYEDMWDNSAAFIVHKTNSNFYIVFTDKEQEDWESNLAHEAFHVCSRALRHKGIRLGDRSEEAFTYFLGYIVNECAYAYKNYIKKQAKKSKGRK